MTDSGSLFIVHVYLHTHTLWGWICQYLGGVDHDGTDGDEH